MFVVSQDSTNTKDQSILIFDNQLSDYLRSDELRDDFMNFDLETTTEIEKSDLTSFSDLNNSETKSSKLTVMLELLSAILRKANMANCLSEKRTMNDDLINSDKTNETTTNVDLLEPEIDKSVQDGYIYSLLSTNLDIVYFSKEDIEKKVCTKKIRNKSVLDLFESSDALKLQRSSKNVVKNLEIRSIHIHDYNPAISNLHDGNSTEFGELNCDVDTFETNKYSFLLSKKENFVISASGSLLVSDDVADKRNNDSASHGFNVLSTTPISESEVMSSQSNQNCDEPILSKLINQNEARVSVGEKTEDKPSLNSKSKKVNNIKVNSNKASGKANSPKQIKENYRRRSCRSEKQSRLSNLSETERKLINTSRKGSSNSNQHVTNASGRGDSKLKRASLNCILEDTSEDTSENKFESSQSDKKFSKVLSDDLSIFSQDSQGNSIVPASCAVDDISRISSISGCSNGRRQSAVNVGFRKFALF